MRLNDTTENNNTNMYLSKDQIENILNGSAPVPTRQLSTASGIFTVTSAATGTNWTTFSSNQATKVAVSNQTGTTLEVRQGGTGSGFAIPTGTIFTFAGITNTNQLSLRRVDTSNTQVTASARWEY
jgi:hypothetical protein